MDNIANNETKNKRQTPWRTKPGQKKFRFKRQTPDPKIIPLKTNSEPYNLNEEISDFRLQALLKNYISENYLQEPKLKGLLWCGNTPIRQIGHVPATFVIKSEDNKHSRFFGLQTCNSPWACPKCSAKVMAKIGSRIACAIEALNKWYHQKAFMITFTIPHIKAMDCDTSYQILQDAWRMFTRAGNQGTRKDSSYKLKTDITSNDKRAVGTKGETRTYIKSHGVYGKMREELKIKHNVRIYEFTWGENSWHPHIHALFWTPQENLQRVKNYESDLLNRWWHCLRKCATKHLRAIKLLPEDKLPKFIDDLFADWRKYPKTGHLSLWISKDENGNIKEQKSSYYISGWSGDLELTASNYKIAATGHFTPFQILQNAYDCTDPDEKICWLELYIEYAMATRGHTRTFFSARSGINAIIRAWQKTNDYQTMLKKKSTATKAQAWKVVCWFTEKQWLQISYLERELNEPIKAEILKLARAPDSYEKIYEYLLGYYDIDIGNNGEHDLTSFIEKTIFENRISA